MKVLTLAKNLKMCTEKAIHFAMKYKRTDVMRQAVGAGLQKTSEF